MVLERAGPLPQSVLTRAVGARNDSRQYICSIYTEYGHPSMYYGTRRGKSSVMTRAFSTVILPTCVATQVNMPSSVREGLTPPSLSLCTSLSLSPSPSVCKSICPCLSLCLLLFEGYWSPSALCISHPHDPFSSPLSKDGFKCYCSSKAHLEGVWPTLRVRRGDIGCETGSTLGVLDNLDGPLLAAIGVTSTVVSSLITALIALLTGVACNK
jgi:hypothetical protein